MNYEDDQMSAEEQMIQDLLCGDRTVADPEIARALQRQPELAKRVDSLLGMSRRLDTIGDDDRRKFAAAVAQPTGLDTRVEEVVRGQRQQNVLRFWPLALAAAAAVMLAVWFGQREVDPVAPRDINDYALGGLAPDELKPSGNVARSEALDFGWNLELPTGGRFVLSVYDPADEFLDAPIVEDLDCGESKTWQPTDAIRAQWRELAGLTWSIAIVDRTGRPMRGGRQVQVRFSD